MLVFSMLFPFLSRVSTAQQVQLNRSHAISLNNNASPSSLTQPATGTLDVIAIMVEFQPDSNRLTSGTGIFGSDGMDGLPFLSRAEDFRIEPLPHDQDYFEAHLELAKNYYEQSSDEKLSLNYHILPEVYQLPQKMEAYSPTGEVFTYEKIAQLTQDAWQAVENEGGIPTDITTGLDPEKTAFIIFHAGIGRDIELTGTNLDITPFDIPSIYLDKNALGDLTDNAAFNGFPVNNGNFRVTNSMIIPRTQSRRGLDIQENEFVFPLSINGLLIASIGSHLGLPDLFNTETGDPGIGRFGLMDGAAFFGYNGLIPPEPSAWEKIYLGWQEPFEIDVNTPDPITLQAASGRSVHSIAKINLSASEYFLIENRHRDYNFNGITLTIQTPEGNLVEKTFTNQDEAFVYQEADFDTLLPAGTIVNASNFEFALPGGLDIGEDEDDPADDRELNGGILIWHIDEAVIRAKLESGGVNANPERRGVDVVEADGAQDIGETLTGALDNSAAFGTAFDFWWAGNNYRVILESGREVSFYENRFGPDTRPNNDSNTGAKSFFELYDFSENLRAAKFSIRAVENSEYLFEQLFSTNETRSTTYFTWEHDYYDYFPLSLGIHEADTDTFLVTPTKDYTYAFDHLNPVEPDYFLGTSRQQPLFGDLLIIANNPRNFSEITTNAYDLDIQTQDKSVWSAETDGNRAFISSQDGETLDLDFTNISINLDDGSVIQNNSGYAFRSEVVDGKFVGINGNTVSFEGVDIPDYTSNAENRLFAGTIKSNKGNFYYLFEDGAFSIVNPTLEEPIVPIFEEEKAEWPAILDEGRILRINRSESSIEGYNFNGAILNNTPIHSPEDIQFVGTPLVADITGDNIQDILVVGQDEYSVNIFAYELTGEPIEGFPLYVGASWDAQTQPIHPVIYENKLYAVSHRGDLKAWEFRNFTSSQWPARYGKNPYNKVSGDIQFSTSTGPSFSVLNGDETYNWPNPADQETHIRFELEEPGGTVDIQVINLSGRIIFEETVTSPGGYPQEIKVNTRHWGNGGYVARVKATVEGKTEIKLIKIGVVH